MARRVLPPYQEFRHRMRVPQPRGIPDFPQMLRGRGRGLVWRVPRTLHDLEAILRLIVPPEADDENHSPWMEAYRALMVEGYYQRLMHLEYPAPDYVALTRTDSSSANAWSRAVQTAAAFVVDRLPWWVWAEVEGAGEIPADDRVVLAAHALDNPGLEIGRHISDRPSVQVLSECAWIYRQLLHAPVDWDAWPPTSPSAPNLFDYGRSITMLRGTGIMPYGEGTEWNAAGFTDESFRLLGEGWRFERFAGVERKLHAWWDAIHDDLREMIWKAQLGNPWRADAGEVPKAMYGVLIDETPPEEVRRHWPVIQNVGKLLGFYIYDPSLHVHLAEATASYELYLVGYTVQFPPDDDSARDTLWNWLGEYQAGSDPVEYRHAYTVNVLPQTERNLLIPKPGRLGFVGTYDEPDSIYELINELQGSF